MEKKDKIIKFFKQQGTQFIQKKAVEFITDAQPAKGQEKDNSVSEEELLLDGDRFDKALNDSLKGKAGKLQDMSSEQIVMFFGQLAGSVRNVIKFCEVQSTKRAKINAQKDIILARYNAEKELLMAYLEKSFDERKANFKALFDLLDKAYANHDTTTMTVLLDNITKLAASSPFKTLSSAQETRKALENKNHEWDF